jgi:hypothetical protein
MDCGSSDAEGLSPASERGDALGLRVSAACKSSVLRNVISAPDLLWRILFDPRWGSGLCSGLMMVKDYNLKQVERTSLRPSSWPPTGAGPTAKRRRTSGGQINRAVFRCFLIDSTVLAGAVVTDEFGRMLTKIWCDASSAKASRCSRCPRRM